MTTLPARVAEAWRDTAWRYTITLDWTDEISGVVHSRDLPCMVTEIATSIVVFRGKGDACRAWVDEQCGRAAARVVVEAMGEPSEALVALRPIDRLIPPEACVGHEELLPAWQEALAAFRRGMGIC